MLILAKEFREVVWYPHFRKIKKALRNRKIPFTIKKQPTPEGLLHSIWAREENIVEVKNVISSYYGPEHREKLQERRVDALAAKFESSWYLYLVAVVVHHGKYHPFVFWPIFIAVLAGIVYPIMWYV